MSSITLRSALILLLALPVGCAGASSSTSDEPGENDEALTNAKVRLPANDPCRAVLAPLSLGLAEAGFGLKGTKSVTVSLQSETETRSYAIAVAGSRGTLPYEVTLDNDSASSCMILEVKGSFNAEISDDARTKMKSSEKKSSIPVTVNPAGDECAPAITYLAQAAAIGAVGAENADNVVASLTSETDTRDYDVRIDGKAFEANGTKFENDFAYDLSVSNDSAEKCIVDTFKHRP